MSIGGNCHEAACQLTQNFFCPISSAIGRLATNPGLLGSEGASLSSLTHQSHPFDAWSDSCWLFHQLICDFSVLQCIKNWHVDFSGKRTYSCRGATAAQMQLKVVLHSILSMAVVSMTMVSMTIVSMTMVSMTIVSMTKQAFDLTPLAYPCVSLS